MGSHKVGSVRLKHQPVIFYGEDKEDKFLVVW